VNVQDDIVFKIINEKGDEEKGIGLGVDREVYSMFWSDVSDSYLIGADQRVPFVRHDLYIPEWQAIGNILVKGFLDTGFFPIVISYSFIHYCLFGEFTDENELIDSFLKYLSVDERNVIKEALKPDATDVFQSDEFQEIMEQFKCRTLVKPENINVVIQEIAKQELYQKPHIMASCWADKFTVLKNHFKNPEDLISLYDKLEPTNKKVIALIDGNPATEAERECLSFFKRYIRSLDSSLLKRLLSFMTASELIIVEKIEIIFINNNNKSSFTRRPIAHTCGPSLELPSTYSNFCELREEFANILKQATWEMDIV